MKNLSVLLLGWILFLSCQASHAGLIGENIMIRYDAFTNNGEGDPTFFQNSQTLTVKESGSTAFNVVITDTTITLKLPPTKTPFDGLAYTIEAVDGSLPALDWANFAESYPTFNANQNIEKSAAFFKITLDSLLSDPNFSLSIRILAPSADTVAVPEPPITFLILAGLLAFLGYRSQTGFRIRRHFQA